MATEVEYFERAISLATYMDNMKQLKESSFLIYEKFDVPKDDEFITYLKAAKPRILVITEDWCGDAMMNNPILRRIAEAADLDVRAVYRDEDKGLIDRHLTNGGRSIPIYLLLDANGAVAAKWGPRAATIQKHVMELKQQIPAGDAPDFEAKQKAVYQQITSDYTTKPENWLTVYEDIRKTFLPVIQEAQ
ncbi:thioredoxin family protein [Sporosarcina sp. A2]|uniref:thioredoxin family protein n=1 Tax=Sporosarcina sp. A2 TaxID=3393449 RepID=UPI003D7ADC05